MNSITTKVGTFVAFVSTLLFVIFMILDFSMGSYFVCIFLAIGYIMMASGLSADNEDNKSIKTLCMVFAGIYATFIFIVYFTQLTIVNKGNTTEELLKIFDFEKGSLFFYFDLFGYGIMALSTFFLGLTITTKNKIDKWFKGLLIGHGAFFIPCLILPMTPAFDNPTSQSASFGVMVLEIWCVYFSAICVLQLVRLYKRKN